jgi:hypothetical protein
MFRTRKVRSEVAGGTAVLLVFLTIGGAWLLRDFVFITRDAALPSFLASGAAWLRRHVDGPVIVWSALSALPGLAALWVFCACLWVPPYWRGWRGCVESLIVGSAAAGAFIITPEMTSPGSHLKLLGLTAFIVLVPVALLIIGMTALIRAIVYRIVLWPPPPRPGACEACGYDLTGNVSGVCPECGRTVTVAAEHSNAGQS